MPEGVHSVTYQALDFSGPANDEPARTFNVPVDLTPPVAKALSPSPLIWSKLLSSLGLMPKVSTLNFSVQRQLGAQRPHLRDRLRRTGHRGAAD